MPYVLGLIFFIWSYWMWRLYQTAKERIAIINWIYDQPDWINLDNAFHTVSFDKHLWYRSTFRKPPYPSTLDH